MEPASGLKRNQFLVRRYWPRLPTLLRWDFMRYQGSPGKRKAGPCDDAPVYPMGTPLVDAVEPASASGAL